MENNFLLIFVAFLIAINFEVIRSQNYFGAAFSPYVKNPSFPRNGYTIEDIKQMLKIITTKHTSISTYSMGVNPNCVGKAFDKCDSNALISRAAAQMNKAGKTPKLSLSQGIYQNTDAAIMKREIDNAITASAEANKIFAGTVWGLVFTNEWVTDDSNGPKVLEMIKANKARANKMGLKVGTRVQTCGEFADGGKNQQILKNIAKASDFIMCNMYPRDGSSDPNKAVKEVGNDFLRFRAAFVKEKPGLDVLIGETGWASEGETFNHAVNTVENERKYWEGMQKWSKQNKVKVLMFEAFDEPWKDGKEGEKHFGWWYRPNDNDNKYIEKATGKVFQ